MLPFIFVLIIVNSVLGSRSCYYAGHHSQLSSFLKCKLDHVPIQNFQEFSSRLEQSSIYTKIKKQTNKKRKQTNKKPGHFVALPTLRSHCSHFTPLALLEPLPKCLCIWFCHRKVFHSCMVFFISFRAFFK